MCVWTHLISLLGPHQRDLQPSSFFAGGAVVGGVGGVGGIGGVGGVGGGVAVGKAARIVAFHDLDAYAFATMYDAANMGMKVLLMGTSTKMKELFSYRILSDSAAVVIEDEVAAFMEVVECDTLADLAAALASIHLMYPKGSELPNIIAIFSLDQYIMDTDKGRESDT